MRIDQMLTYDRAMIEPLAPAWSAQHEVMWQECTLVAHRIHSGTEKVEKIWTLSSVERTFLTRLDGQRSIGMILSEIDGTAPDHVYRSCVLIVAKLLEAGVLEIRPVGEDASSA
ncbi:MAG: hypothetical protein HYR60_05385 [Acidobacteria bacterium]|nr:hypothetical protein [Acidobacteriota bacterium]